MARAEVDDTGIEPVTPTMSMWCSTAEPIVRTVSIFTSFLGLIKLSGKYSQKTLPSKVQFMSGRNRPQDAQYRLHQSNFLFELQ